MLDQKASLETQAKQAFSLRNIFRTTARELMADRAEAAKLYENAPNLTWEQTVEKYMAKGLSGDDLYKEIINASQRSNQAVNESLGLKPKPTGKQ